MSRQPSIHRCLSFVSKKRPIDVEQKKHWIMVCLTFTLSAFFCFVFSCLLLWWLLCPVAAIVFCHVHFVLGRFRDQLRVQMSTTSILLSGNYCSFSAFWVKTCLSKNFEMYRKQIDFCQCLVGLGLDLTLILTRINNLWNSAGSLAALIYQRWQVSAAFGSLAFQG